MARIFVSCPLPGDAIPRMTTEHDVVVEEGGHGLGGNKFSDDSDRFDAIVSLLTDRIDAACLDRARRVRIVANVAVGVDNIDLDTCRGRGVVVTNTPGVLTEATADLAFGLLVSAARRIAEGDRLVRRGEFPSWTPSFLVGAPVHGATLGIVGLGRIGQAMARRARGFGMSVIYAGRVRAAIETESTLGATWVALDALFEQADFVSIHCPLTRDTRHIVNAERLRRMRRGAILINTSRGGCVDEAALAQALADGTLAAAGLDVFEDEPRVNSALLERDNVVLTPHIGSADKTTREAMAGMAADNVLAVLAGRPALTPVVK